MMHLLPQRGRTRVALGTIVAAVSLGAAMPALAHDDHGDDPAPDEPYVERIDKQGNIIPEKPHESGFEQITPASLRELEKQLDPQGLDTSYVCANPGDKDVTVIHGYPDSSPKDLKPVHNLGKIIAPPDPCAGKSLVVGK